MQSGKVSVGGEGEEKNTEVVWISEKDARG